MLGFSLLEKEVTKRKKGERLNEPFGIELKSDASVYTQGFKISIQRSIRKHTCVYVQRVVHMYAFPSFVS